MTQQKRFYIHHEGEFHHNYCVVMSLHDSDHGGVVRIFVGHSKLELHYAAQFFPYQECNYSRILPPNSNGLHYMSDIELHVCDVINF